jgi:isopenicillin-N epimerase
LPRSGCLDPAIARKDRQAGVHPNVISHGYTASFHAEFDWTGTLDPTP